MYVGFNPVCMPNGRPAPFVLTEADLIEFLSIDGQSPRETLWQYRRQLGLKAMLIGRHIRFCLPDVLAWLEKPRDRVPESQVCSKPPESTEFAPRNVEPG